MPELTEQQDRALRLIVDGARQAKISNVLGVSRSRTRQIVRTLCEKFDVPTMADLPDAYEDAVLGATMDVVFDDRFPDDGEIRVDGTHSTV